MLALSSTAPLAFNPINAVAQVGIVGFDVRAAKRAIAEASPLRKVEELRERVAERCMPLVMSEAELAVEPADQKPKIVGDFGFDPLSLGADDNFSFMREAEIKHGRIAMLAAIGWPLQEIFHPIFVDALRESNPGAADVLVQSGGMSPSLVNGGLFQAEVLPSLALFFAGTALLEKADMSQRAGLGCAWNEYPNSFGTFGRQPGNFGFDPLNFYQPLNYEGKVAMQERELLNGRVAMAAVAAFVGVEGIGGAPVVRATPELFQPLIFVPWFRAFMDSAFGTASMDGSINGVAY